MNPIGYVVVEYNQASGQPSTGGQVFTDIGAARDELKFARDVTAEFGRRETHALGVVTRLDEEER